MRTVVNAKLYKTTVFSLTRRRKRRPRLPLTDLRCMRPSLIRRIRSITTPRLANMRAVIVAEASKAKASSLSIGEIDNIRLSKDNDVLVSIKAFGLNRMDIMQRKGLVRIYYCPVGLSLDDQYSTRCRRKLRRLSAWSSLA